VVHQGTHTQKKTKKKNAEPAARTTRERTSTWNSKVEQHKHNNKAQHEQTHCGHRAEQCVLAMELCQTWQAAALLLQRDVILQCRAARHSMPLLRLIHTSHVTHPMETNVCHHA
jgi:hypothetical protein